jgi:hypothetical protein
MNKYFTFGLVLACLLVQAIFAQDQNKNLIEKVDILFSMPAEPTPESVGFDNPKSYWKLEYELVLSDSFVLERLGRCERTPQDYNRLNCPLEKIGKFGKKMRKGALPIAKGEFVKHGPMSEADREVVIPVRLTPEVVDIFNKSVGADKVNPTFILFVKTKASTRAADKAKFKRKLKTEGIHPLKIYNADKTFNDYWNVTKIGISLSLSRGEDGKIRGFGIYRF